MKQIDFSDVHENVELLSEVILNNEIVIVNGFVAKGFIKKHPRGFTYDIYDLNAEWNEKTGEFKNDFLRDGGICTLGDNVDTAKNFIELMKKEEQRG